MFPVTRKHETVILPAIGRPPFRERPTPSERLKDYKITPRAIRWLWLINEHGPQNGAYLHAADWRTHKSYDGTKDAVTKLWRAGYTYRPKDQVATLNAERNYYVYDLEPKAIELLKSLNYWLEPYREASDWRHYYGLSAVTTSIRLLAEQDGVDVKLAPEWITPENRFHSIPFYWGNEIKEFLLKPDDILVVNTKPNPCIYFIEFDRGTERQEPTTWTRKSSRRVFLQYDYLVGQGYYKELYGTQFQAKVLFITTSGERGNNMLHLAKQILVNPDWLCFNVVEGFDKFFKPPENLLTHLYDGEYFRAGYPPWRIKKSPA